jgi:hypothetical protein
MNRYGLRLLLLRLYATVMLWVVGRALVATSRVDETVRAELAPLPQGYQIQMLVMPSGPGFVVECQGDGMLARATAVKARPDLRIAFKHVAHAFLVLGFQEGTAQAFARDRMVVHGDVSDAIRLVRCLNTMESLILPRWIAQRAVKRYPRLGVREKTVKAARIYALFAKNLLLFK